MKMQTFLHKMQMKYLQFFTGLVQQRRQMEVTTLNSPFLHLSTNTKYSSNQEGKSKLQAQEISLPYSELESSRSLSVSVKTSTAVVPSYSAKLSSSIAALSLFTDSSPKKNLRLPPL